MDFTQQHLDGLAPIIVYDPNFTKDEENNKVIRVNDNEPMWLVGVMLVKPANLDPGFIAFPYDGKMDPYAFTPEKQGKKTVLKEIAPPATPDEVLKELALRQEFEAKKRQDEEAQFAEFKRTKEGKDEVPESIQANP